MAKDYGKILAEILLVLRNINDKARESENTLFDICTRLNRLENEKNAPTKHIVVLKREDKKDKGEK